MAWRQDALIALGGNMPLNGEGPATTLRRAVAALAEGPHLVRATSRFFATPCFPAGAGPDYINAALVLRLAQGTNPGTLLRWLHAIEARFSRARETRWGMRTLDLDLIAIGDMVLPDAAGQTAWRTLPPEEQIQRAPDRLILPHPRLQDRGFVLVPLCDVAPDWHHPLLGATIREMTARLPEAARADATPI